MQTVMSEAILAIKGKRAFVFPTKPETIKRKLILMTITLCDVALNISLKKL